MLVSRNFGFAFYGVIIGMVSLLQAIGAAAGPQADICSALRIRIIGHLSSSHVCMSWLSPLSWRCVDPNHSLKTGKEKLKIVQK